MLKNSAKFFKKIYIATGYTDLRCGIKGLVARIELDFGRRPFDKDVLYLFCGKRNDRIKCLVWEGDGWLLMYKRLEKENHFTWPRIGTTAISINEEQFNWLMHGFSIYAGVNEVCEMPKHYL